MHALTGGTSRHAAMHNPDWNFLKFCRAAYKKRQTLAVAHKPSSGKNNLATGRQRYALVYQTSGQNKEAAEMDVPDERDVDDYRQCHLVLGLSQT